MTSLPPQLPACDSRRRFNDAAGTYFCADPRVHIAGGLVTPVICRMCDLPGKEPPTQLRPMPTLVNRERSTPCFHLGELLRLEACETCRGNVQIKVFECLHAAHDTTNYQVCQMCWDYEPALGRVRKWAVGMTTAPRREATLARTLKSLADAGWAQPRLFAEPGSEIPAEYRRVAVTWRESRMGAWGNWLLGLTELYHRHPQADAYLMVQDDAVFCQDVRNYLETVLWPEPRTGAISIYCPTPYTRESQGFHSIRSSDGAIGAVALAFSPAGVRSLLTHSDAVSHHLHAAGVDAVDIDGVVGRWAAARSVALCYHSPSLAQHIGECSTLWQGVGARVRRRADSFVGEQSSALKLFERAGQASVDPIPGAD